MCVSLMGVPFSLLCEPVRAGDQQSGCSLWADAVPFDRTMCLLLLQAA